MINGVHQVDINQDTYTGSYTVKVHTNNGSPGGRSVLWTPNKREAWEAAKAYEGASIYYKHGNEKRLVRAA